MMRIIVEKCIACPYNLETPSHIGNWCKKYQRRIPWIKGDDNFPAWCKMEEANSDYIPRLPDVITIQGEEFKRVDISRPDVNIHDKIRRLKKLRGVDDREKAWHCFQDIIEAIRDMQKLTDLSKGELETVERFIEDMEAANVHDFWEKVFDAFRR